MKKQIILSVSIIFAVLLISSTSAEFRACFDYGDKIDYCNNYKPSWTCSDLIGCEKCMSVYNQTSDCYVHGVWGKCNQLSPECSQFGNSSIDSKSPNMTINNPEKDIWYNSKSILVDIKLDEESDVYYIDNINGRGRWVRVCQDCLYYSGKRSFNEGLNNITFRAVDVIGNEINETRIFFIDSKKPTIHKTEPRSGYASGTFDVQYSEDNLKSMRINYGNNETGMKSEELSNCSSGKKQLCSIDIDLSDYNEQKIKYWFSAEDKAGNIKDSQIKQNLNVDTIYPVLNNLGSFWNYTNGERYVYFKLNVTEENLDKITYSYLDSRGKLKTSTLCSRLDKYGICEIKKSFARGNHTIDIQITDKAGNAIGDSTGEFSVDY